MDPVLLSSDFGYDYKPPPARPVPQKWYSKYPRFIVFGLVAMFAGSQFAHSLLVRAHASRLELTAADADLATGEDGSGSSTDKEIRE